MISSDLIGRFCSSVTDGSLQPASGKEYKQVKSPRLFLVEH